MPRKSDERRRDWDESSAAFIKAMNVGFAAQFTVCANKNVSSCFGNLTHGIYDAT